VVAGCFAANTASWTLTERVGMRREQHAVADALQRSGRWMDSFGDALLAEEWRRRQQM
jgi:RimJ/RimL family protein N-acetyltransferase